MTKERTSRKALLQVLFTSDKYKNANKVFVRNEHTGKVEKMMILDGNRIRRIHANAELLKEEFVEHNK